MNRKIEEQKNLVCIVCPVGCRLTVWKDETQENGYRIEGNQCRRGVEYGLKEQTNPTRKVPSTVKIKNGTLKRLPVITEKAIPKALIFQCMEQINQTEVTAPVKMGDIIIKNVCNTGINVIATRSIKKQAFPLQRL